MSTKTASRRSSLPSRAGQAKRSQGYQQQHGNILGHYPAVMQQRVGNHGAQALLAGHGSVQKNETAEQHIQRKADSNKKDSRFKRIPPGPGAYTDDEYKEWLRLHPDHAFSLGGPWESKSFYARYTPEWFSSRGYFYSGRMFGGFRAARIEVWLSNEGKGKEYRVFRQPQRPKSEQTKGPTVTEPTEQMRSSFNEAELDRLESDALKLTLDLKKLQNSMVRQRLLLTENPDRPDYATLYNELIDWSGEFQHLLHSELGELMPAIFENYLEVVESPEDLERFQFLIEHYEILVDWESTIPDWFDKLPPPS